MTNCIILYEYIFINISNNLLVAAVVVAVVVVAVVVVVAAGVVVVAVAKYDFEGVEFVFHITYYVRQHLT